MKKNEKGFIAITIIYSFFILFITIMLLIMYSYIHDRKTSNKIKSDLINELKNKAPDIVISQNGSMSPQLSYTVNVNILDGGNGIASATYVWAYSPSNLPESIDEMYREPVDLPSYSETLTSPTEHGYYYLIVKACDPNANCKTVVTNSFRVGYPYICLKATALHNETCANSDSSGYCLSAGYDANSVINYGTIPIYSNSVVGDAYDCDINADGEFDPQTERFYYISDYYDTTTKEYDTTKATLVYYSNVHNGTANSTHTAAYTTSSNFVPSTIYTELPSTSQWDGINLVNNVRNVISAYGGEAFLRENYEYTGDVQTFTAFYPGVYKFELWGASGGGNPEAVGGGGAYTSGYITLDQNQVFYIYVGGQGKANELSATEFNPGGWNGGGATGGQYNESFGSGGGATDIRLVSGSWDDEASLKSRIMVAAGGGGGYYGEYGGWNKDSGGPGGDQNGRNGNQTNAWGCYGLGATQLAGGKVTTSCNGNYTSVPAAGFGYGSGGNGVYAGGGGGYYGGSRSGVYASGGGGSSFISGHLGCIALASADSLDPIEDCEKSLMDGVSTDDTCSFHYSGFKFYDTDMLAGNEYMPSYNGLFGMFGNDGNGHARVTYMGVYDQQNDSYTLPTDLLSNEFTYTNKSARLLSYKELYNCLDFSDFNGLGAQEVKIKSQCNFLYENTKFSSSSKVEGFYLENPSDDQGNIWSIKSSSRAAYNGASGSNTSTYGVRPVIEVDKSLIEH